MFTYPELRWNSVYGGYGVASLNMATRDHELRLIGADGTASEPPLVFPSPVVMPSGPENAISVLSVTPTGEWGLVQDIYSLIHLVLVSADGTQYNQPEDLA